MERHHRWMLGLVAGLLLLWLPAQSLKAFDVSGLPESQGDTPAAFTPTEQTYVAPVVQGTMGDAAATPPSCRYGATATQAAQRPWIETLGLGWYLDFQAHAADPAVSREYVQLLWVWQKKVGCTYYDDYTTAVALEENALGALVRAHPGSMWIVSNEVDRGPNPEDCTKRPQGDTYPEVYARAYHDVYYFIKERDPSARVAISALVEVTPGRLQYLDKVWSAYQQRYGKTMPVDVWNMHLYVLAEALPDGRPNGIASVALGTDPALAIRESGGDPNKCSDPNVYCYAEHDSMAEFEKQVRAMRTWMKDHGEQNKPLVLSEFGILFPEDLCDEYGNCFTQARVEAFMKNVLTYLEGATDSQIGYPRDQNRLIQRWAWFSVYHYGVGAVSNLLTPNLSAMTQLGVTYKARAEASARTVNLYAQRAIGSAFAVPGPTGPYVATLNLDFLNVGSVETTQPVKVTFYSNSGLTQVIGSATISAAVAGCEAKVYRASVQWTGLSAGQHQFWAKVDADNVFAETNESDNVLSGVVSAYPQRMQIPLIFR